MYKLHHQTPAVGLTGRCLDWIMFIPRHAFLSRIDLTFLLSTKLQSSRHLKSPRHTHRRTFPRIGIEVPPDEMIAILTGVTLHKSTSLVAFLYRCKGTTLSSGIGLKTKIISRFQHQRYQLRIIQRYSRNFFHSKKLRPKAHLRNNTQDACESWA